MSARSINDHGVKKSISERVKIQMDLHALPMITSNSIKSIYYLLV